MSSFNSFGCRVRQQATIAALAAAIVLGLSSGASARNVLIAGDVLPANGPSLKAVYQFNSQGTLIDTFGETTLGSYFSIAVQRDTIYVGVTEDGIKRFSLAGDFLGYTPYPQRPGFSGIPRIETDAAGNLYYINGTIFYRVNPDGSQSNVFPRTGTLYGIDADASGNVYTVGQDSNFVTHLTKYGAAGAHLGSLPVLGASDVAIDEAAGILYMATGGGPVPSFIDRYDISGPLPVLTGSIPAPGVIVGLSYDPATGHLFTTSLFAGRGYELTTDGTVLQRFDMGVDAFALAAFDIVAIPAPEPATGFLVMCVASLAFAVGRSRR